MSSFELHESTFIAFFSRNNFFTSSIKEHIRELILKKRFNDFYDAIIVLKAFTKIKNLY